VTSVLPFSNRTRTTTSSRRRRQQSSENNNPNNNKNNLPPGQSLGSGSAFVVDRDGYLVTNYHVVERAYQMQQAVHMYETNRQSFVKNATTFLSKLPSFLDSSTTQKLINTTLGSSTGRSSPQFRVPDVYVRINSATQYQSCRIVKVEPELDIAVLKITNSSETFEPVEWGSSSNLLVGQGLVAIGNPFGLDNTVTSGVVSALGRDIGGVAGNTIKGCIQTDCAINPGNSGGPTFDLGGKVVGVNTAIVTTSGSNAGIGFALPSDKVEPRVTQFIKQDRIQQGQRPKTGFLGLKIVKQGSSKSDTSSSETNTATIIPNKQWVSAVQKGSPADDAGIQPLQISDDGKVQFGDCIVAIGGGKDLETYDDFMAELEYRVAGEVIAITLEDAEGERRVAYVKLGSKP